MVGGGVIGIVTFIDKEGEIYLLYLDKQMTLKGPCTRFEVEYMLNN